MAATVTIRRWTGSGPTKTDITSINTRANAEDTHTTAGTSNPIQIPTSGSNFSYWVTTRLSADSTPAGTINNIKWYTDGANGFGTGVTATVGTVPSATGYTQATGTAGTTGTELLSANYTGFTPSPGDDPFTFTSGSPKSITGSISNPSTGDFGDFLVYQIKVGTTAGPGATAQETWTWRYDET